MDSANFKKFFMQSPLWLVCIISLTVVSVNLTSPAFEHIFSPRVPDCLKLSVTSLWSLFSCNTEYDLFS